MGDTFATYLPPISLPHRRLQVHLEPHPIDQAQSLQQHPEASVALVALAIGATSAALMPAGGVSVEAASVAGVAIGSSSVKFTWYCWFFLGGCRVSRQLSFASRQQQNVVKTVFWP